MSKGLEALKEIAIQSVEAIIEKQEPLRTQKINELLETRQFKLIEKELKEKEIQDSVLKTISDIIRDFNKGEFANAECALEEITNILKEALL